MRTRLIFVLPGVGAWVASMVASTVPNSELRDYDEALDAGKVLLMVELAC